MSEAWRPVVGFEGRYSVSSAGVVRRDAGGRGARPGHVLARRIQNGGYLFVSLYRGSKAIVKTVHSIVAAAFIGPRPDGCDINHLDGDKTHNAAGNLEYIDRAGNMRHAFRTGIAKHHAILTGEQARQIRSLKGQQRQRDLADRFGVSRSAVASIMRGDNWKTA